MKVILLADVKSLGKKGEVVNVSDAYARNQLIPKKLGVEANSKTLNDLKLQNKHADKVAEENYQAALKLADEIKDKTRSENESRRRRKNLWFCIHQRDFPGNA